MQITPHVFNVTLTSADDSFDHLLPLSPSLDNFLATGGSARLDSRAASLLLHGRRFR